MVEPELLDLLAGERHPGRLGDPAPVRVVPEQRGLDQWRVGDRAGGQLGLLGAGGLGDPGAPDPGRALAVGDDLDRELEQHRVEQALRQRQAGLAARLQQNHVVGAHLAVDGDPLEGAVDGLAQRGFGAVGAVEDGVGLDEAEHRRVAGLDHPRALRLGGEGYAVAAHGAALGPAVGGHDRLRELGAAVGTDHGGGAADAVEDPVHRQCLADFPGRRDRDRRGVEVEFLGGDPLDRDRVPHPLLAGGGVGVAGLDRGGADRAEVDVLAAEPDRGRRGRVAGQKQGRLDLLRSGDHHRGVGVAALLQAAGDGAGGEARRQLGRVELLDALGRLDPARAEEAPAHRRPSVSSRPSIRLRFWTPWPDAPFQRLSIAEKARTFPRSSTVT